RSPDPLRAAPRRADPDQPARQRGVRGGPGRQDLRRRAQRGGSRRDRGQRYRTGSPRAPARADLRSVLHDEADRRGNRPRPQRVAADRTRSRRRSSSRAARRAQRVQTGAAAASGAVTARRRTRRPRLGVRNAPRHAGRTRDCAIAMRKRSSTIASTSLISNSANGMPRQRRLPPPNGADSYGEYFAVKNRSAPNLPGSPTTPAPRRSAPPRGGRGVNTTLTTEAGGILSGPSRPGRFARRPLPLGISE